MNPLPYSVQLSRKRHWQIMRLTLAANENGVDPLTPARKPATLVDDIVGEWVDRTCPQLNVLWDRREAIEAEAIQEAQETLQAGKDL